MSHTAPSMGMVLLFLTRPKGPCSAVTILENLKTLATGRALYFSHQQPLGGNVACLNSDGCGILLCVGSELGTFID